MGKQFDDDLEEVLLNAKNLALKVEDDFTTQEHLSAAIIMKKRGPYSLEKCEERLKRDKEITYEGPPLSCEEALQQKIIFYSFPRQEVLEETLEHLARLWSQRTFVRYSNMNVSKHVSADTIAYSSSLECLLENAEEISNRVGEEKVSLSALLIAIIQSENALKDSHRIAQQLLSISPAPYCTAYPEEGDDESVVHLELSYGAHKQLNGEISVEKEFFGNPKDGESVIEGIVGTAIEEQAIEEYLNNAVNMTIDEIQQSGDDRYNKELIKDLDEYKELTETIEKLQQERNTAVRESTNPEERLSMFTVYTSKKHELLNKRNEVAKRVLKKKKKLDHEIKGNGAKGKSSNDKGNDETSANERAKKTFYESLKDMISEFPSAPGIYRLNGLDILGGNNKKVSPLEQYTTELVGLASEGKLDPLIGREEELERIIQILMRRRKNNPMLVGESGVGKTSIVYGLAQRIANGEIPNSFEFKKIYEMNTTGMLAGTKYRGELESRFEGLIEELKKEKVILFIDEIHMLWGLGSSTEGGFSGATMLKPYLENGSLRCIGTTTYEDYRQTLMKDKGMSRRLQSVDVPELDQEHAIKIIDGIKESYEKHHKVSYTDAAIREAVQLSARHIHDRMNPDKSVDVIDEAGSMHSAFPERYDSDIIDVDEIRSTVARIARIPDLNVITDDTSRLKTLEEELKKVIFGQNTAVEEVVSAIKMSRAGLKNPNRPIASFLFAGPTGVGKTELAKQLSEKLNVKFLRYDMSEFSEKTGVAKLIGSDPGYVGYEAGGLLTNEIMKHPHSVLLLDEIEKAHPSIFNMLLQVMDAARLTDNTGREVSFRNVILIMTSNIGTRGFDQTRVGFDSQLSHQWDERELTKLFPPEFRNRLDATIQFQTLPMDVVVKIVDKFIRDLEFQLSEKQITFNLTDESREYFAKKGYDQKFGARPLDRLLAKEIKKPLADEILFGQLSRGGVVDVSIEDDKPVFKITSRQSE